MGRHRRSQGGFSMSPVAAEVLDTRALLSAGAGAVHSAVHHAGVMTPATHSNQVTVEFLATPYDYSYVGALSLSLHQIPKTTGGHVQAHFLLNTNTISISISISGKVSQVTTNQGPQVIVNLSQVTGSVTTTFKGGGHHTVAKGPVSNVVIYLHQDGSLSIVTADFSAPINRGQPPVNGTLSFTPAPP